jgi:hypothetical protein
MNGSTLWFFVEKHRTTLFHRMLTPLALRRHQQAKLSGRLDLILHAVTLALDNHRFGVVQEPVQHGAGQGAVVVEDFGPVSIRLIGG